APDGAGCGDAADSGGRPDCRCGRELAFVWLIWCDSGCRVSSLLKARPSMGAFRVACGGAWPTGCNMARPTGRKCCHPGWHEPWVSSSWTPRSGDPGSIGGSPETVGSFPGFQEWIPGSAFGGPRMTEGAMEMDVGFPRSSRCAHPWAL